MMLDQIENSMERFFAFARERHAIYMRRCTGAPPPWTEDPILQQFKFTNVFRELDATTVWFRSNVRESLRNTEDVLLATVLFRWFNRIDVGESIFCQKQIPDGRTVWNRRGTLRTKTQMNGWCCELKAVVRAYCGDGPYVNGAYIIKGTDGMDKLSGVLDAFEQFMTETKPCTFMAARALAHWREAALRMLDQRETKPVYLQSCWDWLRQYNYLGPFMAYEIVTDLRHTALLDNAPDIMTWANPGPGAARGLARVHDRFKVKRDGSSKLAPSAYVTVPQMLEEMQDLLQLSREDQNWPRKWPAWEMREVEHTLCEFDKWERARLGQGRPKQIFRSVA